MDRFTRGAQDLIRSGWCYDVSIRVPRWQRGYQLHGEGSTKTALSMVLVDDQIDTTPCFRYALVSLPMILLKLSRGSHLWFKKTNVGELLAWDGAHLGLRFSCEGPLNRDALGNMSLSI